MAPPGDSPPGFGVSPGRARPRRRAPGGATLSLSARVYALLRAASELSAAQAALDRDHELTAAPRDFAVTNVIEAFNRFAVGAQAAKKPLTIKITLSPQSG